MRLPLVPLLLASLAIPAAAHASDPVDPDVILSHQGRLLTDAEVPVEGAQSITLSIYASKDAPVADWFETYDVTVVKGLYAISIGEAYGAAQKRKLPASKLTGERWVGVKLTTGSELVPRLRVGIAPNAVTAFSANEAAHALEADHAATADLATDATNAVNATHAVNATNATKAAHATEAAHALAADLATRATTADAASTLTSTATVPAGQVVGRVSDAEKVEGKNLSDLNGLYAAKVHTHSAADITAGILAFALLPVGTTANTVAAGAHTHAGTDLVDASVGRAKLDPRASKAAAWFFEGEDTDINGDTAPGAVVDNDVTASSGKRRTLLGEGSTNLGIVGRLWGRDSSYFPGPVVFAARIKVSSIALNTKVARIRCVTVNPGGATGASYDIVPAGLNTTEWITLSITCPFAANDTNQFIGIEDFDKTKAVNLSLDYVTVTPGSAAPAPIGQAQRFACRKAVWEHSGAGVICSVDVFLAQPAFLSTSFNGHWYSTSPASYAYVRVDGAEPMDASFGRIHEYYGTWGTMAYSSTWDVAPGKHTVDIYCDSTVCRANGVGLFGLVLPKP